MGFAHMHGTAFGIQGCEKRNGGFHDIPWLLAFDDFWFELQWAATLPKLAIAIKARHNLPLDLNQLLFQHLGVIRRQANIVRCLFTRDSATSLY